MYTLIFCGLACFSIALAILDTRNKKLQQENDRLRNEITKSYRYCTRLEDL
jgi:hypothetical protein